MFSLQTLIHPMVYGKMFLSIILWMMADGIANSGRCQNHLMLLLILGRCYYLIWLMLLPSLTDVIVNYRLMLLPMYYYYYYWLILLPLADVIANCVEDVKPQPLNFCNKCDGWCYCLVADGMATAGWLGRCYCQGSIVTLILVLRC